MCVGLGVKDLENGCADPVDDELGPTLDDLDGCQLFEGDCGGGCI